MDEKENSAEIQQQLNSYKDISLKRKTPLEKSTDSGENTDYKIL